MSIKHITKEEYMQAGNPDWRPFHPAAVAEQSEPFEPLARQLDNMPDGAEYWENSKYQVTVRRYADDPVFGSRGGMVVLGISAADGTARHDWRDFQAIKNQLVGPEAEGFELYPAESRLLDPSNYYVMHVFPTCRIKAGKYVGRDVRDADESFAPQRRLATSE